MVNKISDKTILISGATDGLGRLVARHLAKENANLILLGRDKVKGKQLTDELIKENRNENIRYYNGDFSSFEEVNELADNILKDVSQIDILINNAAIGKGKTNKRELSKDGIELRFQVNYLSHVLLTEKLIPLMSEGSNIINVASIGQANIDFDKVMLERGYDGFLAYRQSKTALIMYTFDLAEQLKDKKIKVNALHPATLMNTKMVIDEWSYTIDKVEEGAEAVENLLLVESSGEYYDKKTISRAIPQAYDQDARNRLRQLTKKLLSKYPG